MVAPDMAGAVVANAADKPAPSATLSEQAAAYWATARLQDVSSEALRLSKRFLLDTLAAGIAGSHSDVVEIAIAAARAASENASAGAVLWGRTDRLPAPQAALVNGTAAHAFELDDFGGCGHSGAVVTPVVLALAQSRSISGREALLALLAGYDLAARVLEGAGGYRPHNDLGWHSTATCGSFGAAAAAARVLGLSPARFADALGIAGTFTGGIWAFLADGAMTKRFHPGKAAENGLSAALLAEAGMSGPRHVLETEWGGFFSTYSRGIATPALTLQGLGREFRIDRSGMKPYACCRGLHAGIDALLQILAETEADSAAIRRISVHGDAQFCLQFDRPKPANLLEAQFSMQYALAVAAVSGRATLDQFQPPRSSEPEIGRLLTATTLLADRVIKPGDYPAIEVELSDGRRFERHVQFAKGAPQNPLSDRELADKVGSLIDPVLGARRRQEIAATVARLEELDDLRLLTRLLCTGDAEKVA
jgi:2-methylcitrate dehydratase PrpD